MPNVTRIAVRGINVAGRRPKSVTNLEPRGPAHLDGWRDHSTGVSPVDEVYCRLLSSADQRDALEAAEPTGSTRRNPATERRCDEGG